MTMPLTTRIAIATLYLRFRNARRIQAERSVTYGAYSQITGSAIIATTEAWNALQSVKAIVHAELNGDRMPTPPQTLLKAAAQKPVAVLARAA